MRKPAAENFPKNFALIRLAEKTSERLRKEREEKRFSTGIGELDTTVVAHEESKIGKGPPPEPMKPSSQDPPVLEPEEELCPEH